MKLNVEACLHPSERSSVAAIKRDTRGARCGRRFVSLAVLAACVAGARVAAAACPAPAWNQVVVYADANLSGACKVLNVGNYSRAPFGSIQDNKVSSIQLGWGVKATLFQHVNYAGNSYTYANGPFNFNLAGWANDDVSSVKVEYRVNAANPPASFAASLPQDTVLNFPYIAIATESATSASTPTFDLGTMKAGTTIRLGTCEGDSDLAGASAAGDTFLRIFHNGVEQAQDDDGCGQSRASYMSYTVPFTGDVTIKAGCYSSLSCDGNMVVRFGEPDSNGSVQDVQFAFEQLSGNSPRRNKLDFRQDGKVLGAYTYHIEHLPHFQGLQRVPRTLDSSPDALPKFLLSGSDNADLYTVQFDQNARADGLIGPQSLPLRAGTKVLGGTSVGSYYDSHDKGHLGGLQASGRWLGGGVELGGAGPSTLRFWDLSRLPNPVLVSELPNSGSASAIALTKLPGKNQDFIMFVGGQSATDAQVWTLSGTYGYADLATGAWEYRGLVSIPEGYEGFQSLNFVNQDNGDLFLVGTVGDGSTDPEGGTDKAVLFKVDRDGGGNFFVTRTSSRIFTCNFGGGRQCGFNAAAGVFVDPDLSALRVYASKAYRPDDGNANMTFVEYF